MRTALIVGSGPAAAGAAIALARLDDLRITVVDIGARLEPDLQKTAQDLSGQRPDEWDADLLAEIIGQPVRTAGRGLPRKRAFGSDFPFRNLGQLDGITATTGANSDVISGAYGGFSNLWGAQVMPFARSVVDEWQVGSLDEHYRAVLGEIPYAAEEDDLAGHFPLLGRADPLPPLTKRSLHALANYDRHRQRLHRWGITMGKARLAMRGSSCVLAGLCHTGCPYGLVYSASHTFDRLRAEGRIEYRDGVLVTGISESKEGVRVVARDLPTNERVEFTADRAFIACGGIGTTRLVAGSLKLLDRDISMAESQQFVLPTLSVGPTRDPGAPLFTLNQFNQTLAEDDRAYNLAQIHYYTYNPAFVDALPAPLRWRASAVARSQLLRRLSVAIGYLPSWRSPRVNLRLQAASEGELPNVSVSGGPMPDAGRSMMIRTILRLTRAGFLLDLYPLLPMLSVSKAGKSYHFGGSFPHCGDNADATGSDRLGRVGGWSRVHLVDASVFPSVPATTFTLTVMANAHRIATEAGHLPWQ